MARTEHGLFFCDALIACGAAILSFVGALHRGFAMTLDGLDAPQRNHTLVWSIVPPLIAWPALMLATDIASVVLVAGFLAHYWQYRRLVPSTSLPAWYLPFRGRLTAVVPLRRLAVGVAARL